MKKPAGCSERPAGQRKNQQKPLSCIISGKNEKCKCIMKTIIVKRMHGVWYYANRAYSTWEDALQAAWLGGNRRRYESADLQRRGGVIRVEHLGDITKLDGHDLPAVDVVIGGSPC